MCVIVLTHQAVREFGMSTSKIVYSALLPITEFVPMCVACVCAVENGMFLRPADTDRYDCDACWNVDMHEIA